MSDFILAPLYRVDQFLRTELLQTLTRGGTLEPNKDWSVVATCYSQLQRRRGSFSNDLWRVVERAFEDLTQDLNAIADLFREITLAKGSAKFDELSYLKRANALIARAQSNFSSYLQNATDLLPNDSASQLRDRSGPPTSGAIPSIALTTSLLPTAVNPEPLTLPAPLFDRLIWWCKNNRVLLPVLIFGGGIILLGNVADSVDKLVKFYKTYFASPTHVVPAHSPVAPPPPPQNPQ